MFNLLSIVGPTASGKTALAVQLAAAFRGEVISADSRQVYRGMDIGTGKDLQEYLVNGEIIPFHLIDIVDAGEKYNVFEYQSDFVKVWEDCRQRGVLPVLCGGSGLYVEAVLKGYQLLAVPVNEELRASLNGLSLADLASRLSAYKKLHNTTEIDTPKRAIRAIEIEEYYLTHPKEEKVLPEIRSLIVGVDVSREVRRERITARLHERLQHGMVEEVQNLLDSGIAPEDLIYYGLEYKYLTLYLIGRLKYEDMVGQLNVAIHQFAKRQMTWFRKMEREGFEIRWLKGELSMEEKIAQVRNWWEEGNRIL
ncbi:tRNA (adenosine(37)-N6)-dimethylallyltransferase MiaA [Odoribacter sp. Z80]|uniref:tRNA (adenosine(37)-N6)-dimethylallyltransferase MiaA n=1 Tax=Odoribacter sp. Z80 TaxID=2304575 RepID=UPI00137B1429|nr:tRNA (adenosine(37)-N6)-dimethylallyltransferase MiaA [Odoribacter sp. Z80]NCE72481.1 tRNA (adenosine(37)-N6)-dimethylallyltransferase MiaA [Odoribacter sp. Z80]